LLLMLVCHLLVFHCLLLLLLLGWQPGIRLQVWEAPHFHPPHQELLAHPSPHLLSQASALLLLLLLLEQKCHWSV
jgi:hypothetical protein